LAYIFVADSMALSPFTFVQWAHFRLCCSGYPQQAECLARANKDLDCFGVYPQMIVLSFYWTFSMDISPDFLYEVDRVFNQIHILFYGLSKHLYVAFLLLSSHISSKSSNINGRVNPSQYVTGRLDQLSLPSLWVPACQAGVKAGCIHLLSGTGTKCNVMDVALGGGAV